MELKKMNENAWLSQWWLGHEFPQKATIVIWVLELDMLHPDIKKAMEKLLIFLKDRPEHRNCINRRWGRPNSVFDWMRLHFVETWALTEKELAKIPDSLFLIVDPKLRRALHDARKS